MAKVIIATSFLQITHAFTLPKFTIDLPGLAIETNTKSDELLKSYSLLFPNAQPDTDFSEPLPEGSLGCPFFGNNIFEGSVAEGPETFYQRRSQEANDSPISKFYFLGKPCALVSGAKNMRKLYEQEFETMSSATDVRFFPDPFRGKEEALVIMQDREQHKALRRAMQPSLSQAAMTKALPTIQNAANVHVDKLVVSAKQGNTAIKMIDTTTKFVTEIFGQHVLGLSTEQRDGLTDAFAKLTSAMYAITPAQSIQCPFTRAANAIQGMFGMMKIKSTIESKVRDLERNGPDNISTLSDIVHSEYTQFLTRTSGPVKNGIMLTFASFESARLTTALSILMLSLNKEAWKRLVDEQDEVVSKYGTDITPQVLEHCTYLDAVVKETYRIGSPATQQSIQTKLTLVIEGKQIPKGWTIVGGTRLTHYLDPATYKEDGSHMDVRKGFQPERWLSKKTTPRDYIPFGVSKRHCIGSKLATTELKLFLATLARKVAALELVNKENIEWKPYSAIRTPIDGVEVRISPRGDD